MKQFFKNLQFIFKPNFWLMNEAFDKEWDIKLNKLMDSENAFLEDPNPLDGRVYILSIGDTRIWIQNYPYGYACKYHSYNTITTPHRPSRLTILRLRKLEQQLRNGK